MLLLLSLELFLKPQERSVGRINQPTPNKSNKYIYIFLETNKLHVTFFYATHNKIITQETYTGKKCIHTLRKIKRERRTNLFQYTLERYGVRDLQVQLWERNREREKGGGRR